MGRGTERGGEASGKTGRLGRARGRGRGPEDWGPGALHPGLPGLPTEARGRGALSGAAFVRALRARPAPSPLRGDVSKSL